MLDHFPSEGQYILKSYNFLRPIETVEQNNGAYLKVTYQLNKDDFEILHYNTQQESILITDHSDTCNLITIRGEAGERIGNCTQLVPVPGFVEERDKLNITDGTRLPEDFTLFILDTDKGLFLTNNLLSSNPFLPKEWEHGYSKGIAMNRQTLQAIFWIDIW